MGTRADFYVGRGDKAEWLGSIAWDGYPDGVDEAIRKANSEDTFRAEVASFIAGREDGTVPANGWPWPWADSGTTDYAYAFDDGKVWCSCFGGGWCEPNDEAVEAATGKSTFPNMKALQNTTFGKRSGLIVISIPRDQGGEVAP